MAKNELGKDPDRVFQDAIKALETCISDGARPNPTQTALEALEELIVTSGQAVLAEGLVRLTKVAGDAALEPSRAAISGLGLLIEAGADPGPASKVILDRSAEAFEIAAEERRKASPEAKSTSTFIEPFALTLMALLTRSKEARLEVKNDPDFSLDLAAFEDETVRPSGLVARLNRVLDDEEIVVLHPATRSGATVQIAGMTHNSQLHTLLADVLVPGVVPGKRPPAIVIAEARDMYVPKEQLPSSEASFLMMTIGAVMADGSIDVETDLSEIPGDGAPADIPMLDDTRIVVLAEPRSNQMRRMPRAFPAMVGEIAMTARLSTSDVDRWMQRLATSRDASR